MKVKSLLASLVLVLASLGLAGNAQAAGSVFTARLSAANEVPARDSDARGQAVFRLSADGTALEYRLIVANIDNVVAAHIHLGTAEVNGPVVAFLYGNAPAGSGRTSGVLATGTITADDLVGALEGQSLDALVAEIEAGRTYVNVHTNDGAGDPNTGPGDFLGGEVRGQIG